MEYDVAIIGAGPAGSSAAIQLSRAGRRVLVVEKRAFPRHKVCGGCLSGPATAALQSLIGPDRTPPGIAGRRISFVIGSYSLACDPRGTTWMVTRGEMDDCLAKTASEAGAEVCFGESAALQRGDTGWDVIVGGRTVRAATILIASGIGGLPRSIGIEGRDMSRPMIAQQWIQPTNAALPGHGEVVLHWLRGGYVGLAAPQAESCVVALAAHASETAGQHAFERLRQMNPTSSLWQILDPNAPRRYNARGSAGFPWIPTRLGDGNALLIGDAAGYAEPYSGEGIGQAMRSASCATEAILAGGNVLTTYSALMRRRHRRVVWRTRLVSAILSSSFVQFVASRRPVLPHRALARLVEHVYVTGAL